MTTNKKSRSFGTHSGSFHADEVTACALLLHFGLIDRDKIVRSRDPHLILACEYVCDVGGVYDPEKKLFDHHQMEYQGLLSSAGMVLLYLKNTKVIDQTTYDFFNRSLILGVDAHDNGIEPQIEGFCSFSHIVSNFNPIEYQSSLEAQEKCFQEALNFVLGYLKRLQDKLAYILSCKEIVKNEMNKNSSVLLFEQGVPWLEIFFEYGGENHPAQFVIMPSGGHWKLRAIPPNFREKMKVRTALPIEWAGLHDQDLQQVSKIPGAIFCHKGRFISVWMTKEDALKALAYTLQKSPT